jgi:hypothetical protein
MSAEIWQATDFESVFERSRTKPLVLWCEPQDDDAPARRFVVKSPGHPEVLESNLFAELFGNLLAREFGIPTPSPVIVALTGPLVEAIQPSLPREIQLRAGFGVGSEYLPPLTPLVSDWKIPPALRPGATMIYAFDLLTANFDRRIGNPNCALRGQELLAYDFECCFSFLRALFGPPAWEVSRLKIAEHHIFQRELHALGADWTPFMEALERLDEALLRSLAKDFPTPWLSSSERVFSYLLEAQERPRKLEVELEASLRVVS